MDGAFIYYLVGQLLWGRVNRKIVGSANDSSSKTVGKGTGSPKSKKINVSKKYVSINNTDKYLFSVEERLLGTRVFYEQIVNEAQPS